jgi:hypothetical protein
VEARLTEVPTNSIPAAVAGALLATGAGRRRPPLDRIRLRSFRFGLEEEDHRGPLIDTGKRRSDLELAHDRRASERLASWCETIKGCFAVLQRPYFGAIYDPPAACAPAYFAGDPQFDAPAAFARFERLLLAWIIEQFAADALRSGDPVKLFVHLVHLKRDMFVTLESEGTNRLELAAAPAPARAAAICSPLKRWLGEPDTAFLTACLAWPSAHDRLQFRAVAETPSSA